MQGLIDSCIMAKLKNRHSGRLIDVWVSGNSGNNPKKFQWIKKLFGVVLLIVNLYWGFDYAICTYIYDVVGCLIC